MGIFRQFPYTNFHDLNLDWILKNMRKLLTEWSEYQEKWNVLYKDIESAFDDFKATFNEHIAQYDADFQNYINSINITVELRKVFDQAVADGTVASIINPVIATETAKWLSENITEPTGVVIDQSLTVEGACADAKATGDAITEVKNALNDNTNFTAQMNISHINTGTAVVGGVTVNYSKNNISFSGISTQNASHFISDSFVLPAGKYVLLDNVYHPEIGGVHDWDIRILDTNNQAIANSVTKPEFTLASDTPVRVLLYIFGNKNLNVNTYVELYKEIGILSNKNITEFINNNENINAGKNEATLKTGTWSGSGISATFDTVKTVINGTATANASFFITDLFSLPKGSYYTFDGIENRDGKIRLGVMDSNNVTRAWADINEGSFTLENETSIRLFVYVYNGAITDNFELYPQIVNQDALSNKMLTEIVSGMVGFAPDITKTAIKENGYYPFACPKPVATLKAQFYDCIKNITLFGADINGNYYIRDVFINNSALNPKGTYITVYNADNEKVCEYNKLIVPTNHQYLHFEEFNNSGISAVVEVDFTNIPDNFGPIGASTYDELGISKNCIVQTDEDVQILIPDTIYAVIGIETNIYWDACIKGSKLSDYIVEVVGNGENLGDRWHYIPSTAGTFNITIRVRDNAYRLLAVKTINVISVVKDAPSSRNLKAIHIGDSMIDNDYHLSWLENELSNTNITYTIYGTRPHSEGRGGWTSGMYLRASTDPNVPNPFYNPATETFDFSYYMANQQYPIPDVVFIFLGTNDIKGTAQFSGIEGATNLTIKNINTIIESIHEYDPSIKVCVNTASIGANEQYPYAKMYGNNSIKQALHKYGIQTQTSKMLQTYGDREDENIFVVPTGTSLDNVHGFPTTNVNVSARITEQITVQSDCYHPTSEGYHQFADCEFAFIRNELT